MEAAVVGGGICRTGEVFLVPDLDESAERRLMSSIIGSHLLDCGSGGGNMFEGGLCSRISRSSRSWASWSCTSRAGPKEPLRMGEGRWMRGLSVIIAPGEALSLRRSRGPYWKFDTTGEEEQLPI